MNNDDIDKVLEQVGPLMTPVLRAINEACEAALTHVAEQVDEGDINTAAEVLTALGLLSNMLAMQQARVDEQGYGLASYFDQRAREIHDEAMRFAANIPDAI